MATLNELIRKHLCAIQKRSIARDGVADELLDPLVAELRAAKIRHTVEKKCEGGYLTNVSVYIRKPKMRIEVDTTNRWYTMHRRYTSNSPWAGEHSLGLKDILSLIAYIIAKDIASTQRPCK